MTSHPIVLELASVLLKLSLVSAISRPFSPPRTRRRTVTRTRTAHVHSIVMPYLHKTCTASHALWALISFFAILEGMLECDVSYRVMPIDVHPDFILSLGFSFSDGTSTSLICPDAGTGATSTCAFNKPTYGDPCVSHGDCPSSFDRVFSGVIQP